MQDNFKPKHTKAMELYYFIGCKKISYNFYDIDALCSILALENYNSPYFYDREKLYKIYESTESKKVVVINNESVSVYNNILEFEAVFKDVSDNRVIQEEIMYRKNPYNDKFPKFTEKLGEDFLQQFELNLEEKGTTILRKLDKAINRNLVARKNLLATNFLKIIAFIGELLRLKYPNLYWDMRLSKIDNETWSPFLIYKGKEIAIFLYLEEYLNEEVSFLYFLEDFYLTIESFILKSNNEPSN